MSDFSEAKALVRRHYAELDAARGAQCAQVMQRNCARDYTWLGFHPFDDMHDPEDVGQRFWAPLHDSLTSLQRRQDIFFAGRNEIDDFSSTWVVSMGHLMGLFDTSWLGIRPTRKLTMLRYCEFNRVENGKITQTAMYFDIPHLMQQAGQNPFPPQTGADLVQPGPRPNDGLLFEPQPAEEGQKTSDAINFMITDIAKWSGGKEEPLEDELRRSWHEDMLWWGPAGIGATFTIERYAKQHSGPFREAFVTRKFHGHVAKLSEGAYGGFFGRPNLSLKNHGGFMGMPATPGWGDMRVIDIYRREGDKLAENWIFIDLLHFWKMQGVDILKRTTEIGG